MTAKRFNINNDMDFKDIIETYELNCIVDNENKTFYFIADSIENVQLFIKRLNELHEEKEELESFKKLVYLVLKKEYDLRMNEMNIFAEKEDWQGYRATKLERGTVQRIAKRLGVDLE